MRERLETAFHVVEKEYGVTRLLDAEGKDDILLTLLSEKVFKGTWIAANIVRSTRLEIVPWKMVPDRTLKFS